MTTHLDETLLSALLDGELGAQRTLDARAHLEACVDCARIHGELARVKTLAAELAPPEVPHGLFDKIMAEVAPAQAASQPAPAPAVTRAEPLAPRAQVARVRWFARPAVRGGFVGAGLALAAAAAFMVLMPRPVAKPTTPVQAEAAPPAPSEGTDLMAAAVDEEARGELHYTTAIGKLKQLIQVERVRWPKDVASSFDQSLAEIDRAVERTRTAAQKSPEDPDSQDSLATAYRRELSFLEEMVVRGQAQETP